MPFDQATYEKLYQSPEWAKVNSTPEKRVAWIANIDPRFAALSREEQLQEVENLFSGPRFWSQERIKANQSPAASAKDRFLVGAGLPTTLKEAGQMLKGLGEGPGGQLFPGVTMAVGAAGALGEAAGKRIDQGMQAAESYMQGDIPGGLQHSFGATLVPGAPAFAEGDVAGGLGGVATNVPWVWPARFNIMNRIPVTTQVPWQPNRLVRATEHLLPPFVNKWMTPHPYQAIRELLTGKPHPDTVSKTSWVKPEAVPESGVNMRPESDFPMTSGSAAVPPPQPGAALGEMNPAAMDDAIIADALAQGAVKELPPFTPEAAANPFAKGNMSYPDWQALQNTPQATAPPLNYDFAREFAARRNLPDYWGGDVPNTPDARAYFGSATVPEPFVNPKPPSEFNLPTVQKARTEPSPFGYAKGGKGAVGFTDIPAGPLTPEQIGKLSSKFANELAAGRMTMAEFDARLEALKQNMGAGAPPKSTSGGGGSRRPFEELESNPDVLPDPLEEAPMPARSSMSRDDTGEWARIDIKREAAPPPAPHKFDPFGASNTQEVLPSPEEFASNPELLLREDVVNTRSKTLEEMDRLFNQQEGTGAHKALQDRARLHPTGWRPVVIDHTRGTEYGSPRFSALVQDAVYRFAERHPGTARVISRVEIINEPDLARNAIYKQASPSHPGGVLYINAASETTPQFIARNGSKFIDAVIEHEGVHAAQDFRGLLGPDKVKIEAPAYRRAGRFLNDGEMRNKNLFWGMWNDPALRNQPPASLYELRAGLESWRTAQAPPRQRIPAGETLLKQDKAKARELPDRQTRD